MVFEIFKRSLSGIAMGGLVTFLALTILMINDINPVVSVIWTYMLASFVIGIYFGLASLIFTHVDWSPLTKLIVHFLLSICVYFSVALPLGWIPLIPAAILLSIFFFIVIYSIFWTGFYLYFKKAENSLNDSISKK